MIRRSYYRRSGAGAVVRLLLFFALAYVGLSAVSWVVGVLPELGPAVVDLLGDLVGRLAGVDLG